MIKKLIAIALVLGAVAFAIFWLLTMPQKLTSIQMEGLGNGNPEMGEMVFWAGGCGSCHADKGAKGDDKKRLGGGHQLGTPAGLFVTPNISPDRETGIGSWTEEQFANAMLNGVSPNGSHYYPSFPYTSYAKMKSEDVSHLWAYMKTLPEISRANEPHELSIFFQLRRGVGLWKTLFLNNEKVVNNLPDEPQIEFGQYLVEGVGHCGECHTPRTAFGFGGYNKSKWLGGGLAPEGDGKIPNITPGAKEIGSWSVGDIAGYLKSGFTPEFDSVGGSMVSVQENMAKLPDEDLEAIAAYLKAIPSISD
jgi:mono/diheme cytochrome c family protein